MKKKISTCSPLGAMVFALTCDEDKLPASVTQLRSLTFGNFTVYFLMIPKITLMPREVDKLLMPTTGIFNTNWFYPRNTRGEDVHTFNSLRGYFLRIMKIEKIKTINGLFNYLAVIDHKTNQIAEKFNRDNRVNILTQQQETDHNYNDHKVPILAMIEKEIKEVQKEKQERDMPLRIGIRKGLPEYIQINNDSLISNF